MKKFFIFTFVLMSLLAISVSASNKISPAIDVIANDNSMVKAGVPFNGELIFDVDDFDDTLGTNVSSITITSLPSQESGRLMLDNLYVVENQVIYRDDFSLLKFVQTTKDNNVAIFKFKPQGSDYEIECSLKALQIVNLPPVTSNGEIISTWTKANISSFGTLPAFDPENDNLKYEIVSFPKKGLIALTNATTGDYKYSPYIDAKGTDSFTYRVRDSYGNYSETCLVEISIEKLNASLVFSDVEKKHLNAVLVMYENSLMECTKNGDGTLSFKPNEEITREEFLVLVMTAMGAKDVPLLDKTRFADDMEIKKEYKGYIESALSLGIIKGTNEDDGLHFNPKGTLTLAEGAVIINNIIGASANTSMTVFLDDDQIPDWARSAITSLTEIGVLRKTDGKIEPNSTLTRAQVAQILMSLLEIRGKLH